MQKKFDNLFAALMFAAAIAVVLAGGYCLSHSIERAKAEPAPVVAAPAHVELPRPTPTPEPVPTPTPMPDKPAYDPAIPLDAELQAVLYEVCEDADVPVPLALGLIEVESNFQVDAVSAEGCVGLMQINPLYAWKLEEKTGSTHTAPDGNIRCGVWYLAQLIEKYDGNQAAALVAYNQGSYNGTVTTYAHKVLGAAAKWEKAMQ